MNIIDEIVQNRTIYLIGSVLLALLFAALIRFGFTKLWAKIEARFSPPKTVGQIYFNTEMLVEMAKKIAAPGIVADEFGTIVYVNEELTELLHWREEEMMGKNLDMIVPEKSRDMHNRMMEEWRRTGYGKVFNHPMQLKCLQKGNIEIPVEITIKEMPVHGKMFVVGKIRDMRRYLEQIEEIKTECSRENKWLREEIEMYREIEKKAHGGMMKWLYAKNRVVMSKGMQNILDIHMPECYTADTTNKLLPEDREKVSQVIVEAVEQHAKGYKLTFRLLSGKTICLSAGIDYNRDGKPLIVYGIMHEID